MSRSAVALAAVFRERFFQRLGGAITVCGLTGLVLGAVDGTAASLAIVRGIVPAIAEFPADRRGG